MKNHSIKLHKLEQVDKTGGVLIYITANINGEAVNLLVDTGASKTCIGQKCFERVKKENTQFIDADFDTVGIGTIEEESKLVTVELLQFNSLKLKNIELVIIEWDNVALALEKTLDITMDGVLGSDILEEYNAVIDYAKEKIILQQAK